MSYLFIVIKTNLIKKSIPSAIRLIIQILVLKNVYSFVFQISNHFFRTFNIKY